ncbi:methyl-accepting chemotaxis protein [Campylobacter sp. 19-13652]|uniref:methyl-accepting chemotaxis protein n=1 Tax=Campylobacter sp. 19-13652 TaxID=2840180 RepID=UPI001C7400DD|nr:methyl-accepting chemotaxis protein [Campylobacter sp. 19-13652]BCX80165.1 chemotaxis protein [Campylobacter sp. 19-13652]
MRKLNLVTKISLLVVCALVLGFGIFAYKNYTNIHESVFDIVIGSKERETSTATKAVDNYINDSLSTLKSIGEVVKSLGDMPDTEVGPLLAKIFKTTWFDSIYVGYAKDGRLIGLDKGNDEIFYLNKIKNDYDARIRPWYIAASSLKTPGVAEPYEDHTTHKFTVGLYAPIYEGDELKFVVGANIFLDTLRSDMSALYDQKNGESRLFIITPKANLIMHTDPNMVMIDKPAVKEVVGNLLKFYEQNSNKPYYYGLSKHQNIALCDRIEQGWLVCYAGGLESFSKKIDSISKNQIIYSIIFVIIMIAILVGAIKWQLRPLDAIKAQISDFFSFLNYQSQSATISNISTRDEFGEIGQMINENIQNIEQNLKDEAAFIKSAEIFANRIKDGEFDASIDASSKNPALNSLKDTLTRLSASLQENIGKSSNEILSLLDDFKARDFTKSLSDSGKIASGVNLLGEQIASILKENLNQANLLNKKSIILKEAVGTLNKSASDQAAALNESATAIEQMNGAMHSISVKADEVIRQSDDIKNVITIIRDIADQTNLLALNAAIEAARAGEHGRGFAVVADEVRKLAERTQKSLSEIEANANILTQSINEMSSSIQEQTGGISQVNESIVNIDNITKQNLQIANDTNTVTSEVEAMAAQIVKEASKNKF